MSTTSTLAISASPTHFSNAFVTSSPHSITHLKLTKAEDQISVGKIDIEPKKEEVAFNREDQFGYDNKSNTASVSKRSNRKPLRDKSNELSEILFITSYPPRECGIATYSQDLIKALNNKFSDSLCIKVCAMESGEVDFNYSDEVKYTLKTSLADQYGKLASKISSDNNIKIVLIQHEFGFFRKQEEAFLQLLTAITKPVVIVFHTVLPSPDNQLKSKIKNIAEHCDSIVVMTHNSAAILINDYDLSGEKISVIAHGTHLVPNLSKEFLKKKYDIEGRKVLTTFGLLSSGKSIETTLEALPEIIKTKPEVMFLIIGKTHPEVLVEEGEKYRKSLEDAGLVISGVSPDNILVEMVEIKDHPWFLGCQFHPEFKSRPNKAHPIFKSFMKAAIAKKKSKI